MCALVCSHASESLHVAVRVETRISTRVYIGWKPQGPPGWLQTPQPSLICAIGEGKSRLLSWALAEWALAECADSVWPGW